MLLAHKPHPPPFMSPNISHRRHPSAPPAVVVQATKTPGLLFISKQPSRPSTPRSHPQQLPQSHQKQHRSPRPKQRQLVPHSQGRATQPPISESCDEPTKPSSQKNKGTTSPSSNAQARRSNIRQPSPPILSQAEGTTSPTQTFTRHNNNPASNSFDPFVVSSDSDSDNSLPPMTLTSKNISSPAPSLTSQPAGKLAVRRRRPFPQQIATPTPSTRAVPVPRSNIQTPRHNLSRSAPSQSAVPLRTARRTSAGSVTDFPVCDDTTDVDDDNSPLSTPTRERSAGTWQQLTFEGGPRTAPLNASTGFPFGGQLSCNTPSPSRKHFRTPSEGVFHMSFDEDMASASDASEDQRKLFGFMSRKPGSVGPSITRAAKDKAGFFASSVFQNSPSPDELPPPAF
ncbi:uncharacterized protein F5891DRAFT_947984 [Suillus fuscotomentosus]|uniref:Uncharacterized protein n=1 Tax=Suillus fuscotomentosus TaxID=1912939 RepID=A0AAD4HMI8_9AGAM|nr:uncharacterized protein F5891DRAFT_947984 [Suillus fuscotomentosus]KAG1903150.1 hypothetical protein F5891DRAFT_947984 [Suillus fuscotomentosus]